MRVLPTEPESSSRAAVFLPAEPSVEPTSALLFDNALATHHIFRTQALLDIIHTFFIIEDRLLRFSVYLFSAQPQLPRGLVIVNTTLPIDILRKAISVKLMNSCINKTVQNG